MDMKKECKCVIDSAIYYDFGQYRCQYCCGLIVDQEILKKFIEYNTPREE